MRWQALSRHEAQSILAKGLGCTAQGEGLRIAAIAECLRAACFLCAMPSESRGAWIPAASLSLTSLARKHLGPIWPGMLEDSEGKPGVLSILDSLEQIGDLVRVEKGWLPPPPRAIRSQDGYAVVLGGGPSPLFPRSVKTRAFGRVRVVPTSHCAGWLDVGDPSDWIGAPLEGLAAWSSRFLVQASKRFTCCPTEVAPISVYVQGRWSELVSQPSTSGHLLGKCRTENIMSYFIGKFHCGRLEQLASIDAPDARRLRFYLDLEAGRPCTMQIESSQRFVTLRSYRRLPPEQEKALLLGWELPKAESDHAGLKIHVIPVETFPIVRCALEGLGIVLVERGGAQGGI
ncbi:hypothetical protein PsP108CL_05900 [Pseudomonas syringae]|nr:hypothetical protein [Pseudomonas syringae]